jgi:hypothetical protein
MPDVPSLPVMLPVVPVDMLPELPIGWVAVLDPVCVWWRP